MEPKPTPTEHPIADFLTRRWSPRSFTGDPVNQAALRRCLEAARWAASCFNDQPWRYLVADRARDPEGFERLASCLVAANAKWATNAPVLMLACARTTFERNEKPNRHGAHDLGQASAQLALQAAQEGLAIHQMGGFDVDRAREVCKVPRDVEPIAMIALGHQGPAGALPEDLRESEQAPRARKSQKEWVFGTTFGEPPTL